MSTEVESKNPELWRLDDSQLSMLERYWTKRIKELREEIKRRKEKV